MEVEIRAFKLSDSPSGHNLFTKEFKINRDLLNNRVELLHTFASVFKEKVEDINLFWKDDGDYFVPCFYNDEFVARVIEAGMNGFLEIYVQKIVFKEESQIANKTWSGEISKIPQTRASVSYRHYLKKICESRLMHNRSSFNACSQLLMTNFENQISVNTAWTIFEECRVFFYDDKNFNHVAKIPRLMTTYSRVALIFDADFQNVVLCFADGKWTLPELRFLHERAIVSDVDLENKFSKVSFLDVVVNRQDTPHTLRAYFFLDMGDDPRLSTSNSLANWISTITVLKNELKDVENDALEVVHTFHALLVQLMKKEQ